MNKRTGHEQISSVIVLGKIKRIIGKRVHVRLVFHKIQARSVDEKYNHRIEHYTYWLLHKNRA